ncbi:MAG TPA: HEAT repeat domain-containing protein [Candidatus Sulfopaludibacter sp.]|jgi:HEAT repeat protein|nr:HEAT repeat domain-containing protein [Candidatus Sulfopaludibacter sp.]
MSRASLLAVLTVAILAGQQAVRPKDVREIGKAGSSALPRLQEFLKNPDRDVRAEAVKQITEIGPPRSLDPLILATQDNDPEVQMLATDGIVNFYLPGYVKTGLTAPLRKVGTSLKGKFTDTNDQVIEAYITPRADAIAALGKLVRSGASMDARAGAARAVGILRGKAAVPDLLDATHSKNSELIYESLIALQKIRDESAGPGISFLLHDLDPRVQIAAIETTGLLRNKEAVPALADVLTHSKDAKVRRAALTSMAMLPTEKSRGTYSQYLNDKDDRLRAAAAEGFARLKNPADVSMLDKAWQDEGKPQPRLSLAFALVMDGKTELSEFSPLQFLINNLNSAAYNGEAFPFLVELARDARVRELLYAPLETGTKAEKIGLAGVLARSGDAGSVAPLQKLTNDPDPAVAQAALTAVRNLQARL